MTDILMRPLVRLQVYVAELREREDGQTTTEYAILLGFLAIAIIVALYFLRNILRDLFSDAASSVSNAPGRRKGVAAVSELRRSRGNVRRPGYPLDRAGAYVFRGLCGGGKITLGFRSRAAQCGHDGTLPSRRQGKETQAHVGAAQFR